MRQICDKSNMYLYKGSMDTTKQAVECLNRLDSTGRTGWYGCRQYSQCLFICGFKQTSQHWKSCLLHKADIIFCPCAQDKKNIQDFEFKNKSVLSVNRGFLHSFHVLWWEHKRGYSEQRFMVVSNALWSRVWVRVLGDMREKAQKVCHSQSSPAVAASKAARASATIESVTLCTSSSSSSIASSSSSLFITEIPLSTVETSGVFGSLSSSLMSAEDRLVLLVWMSTDRMLPSSPVSHGYSGVPPTPSSISSADRLSVPITHSVTELSHPLLAARCPRSS